MLDVRHNSGGDGPAHAPPVVFSVRHSSANKNRHENFRWRQKINLRQPWIEIILAAQFLRLMEFSKSCCSLLSQAAVDLWVFVPKWACLWDERENPLKLNSRRTTPYRAIFNRVIFRSILFSSYSFPGFFSFVGVKFESQGDLLMICLSFVSIVSIAVTRRMSWDCW